MADKRIIRDESGRARLLQAVLALNLSKPQEVVIRPYKRSRSLEQNALYHKWCGIVADETGNSHDDVHEWLKAQFLPPVFVEINGMAHEVRRTTTKLKVDEMSAFMDKVYAWATSELGLRLPVPEEAHMRAA